VAGHYFKYLRSFEGIKDPKTAPGVDKIYWFLYTVHLGTRFSRSSRDAIAEDLKTHEIERPATASPCIFQRYYLDAGPKRGELVRHRKDRCPRPRAPAPSASHRSPDRVHRGNREGRFPSMSELEARSTSDARTAALAVRNLGDYLQCQY